ncbi:U2 snRNP-associated SURP motif-containing protein-like [Corticium candelabrum]|uniref:U2 snRNP-associated SURP motif-containing protein-like n=1 Tax=Corticium candelabrum TaxID=121492 RepID=UPI002E2648E5|nr:U2 snRNP-associated SURP motif-containing protein-like [Corticium candelabrum]
MAFKKSGWVKSGEMQAKAQTRVKPLGQGKSKPLSAAKKKEKEEERKKEEAERAAAVYADFVAEFENPTATVKAFVRGSTINPDTKEETVTSAAGLLYEPAAKLHEVLSLNTKVLSSETNTASAETGFPLPKPKKIKAKEKKKTNLELFKEELKRSQEERDERHKVKQQIADAVAVTGDPTPFLPEPLLPGQGSLDLGDPLTTNLYVGNLHPKMNEETLCHYFGKYGPLASVKIMWPRTEEERTRQKNCGFVAFMKREHAAKALDELGDKEILGLQLKIGWGKSIPIPPAPFYVPPEMREHQLPAMPPPPSGLPFNAQHRKRPENTGDSLDLEDCIVRVVIPHDKDLLRLIHRMIEFLVHEGPEFEAIIMQREINNSSFSFLFDCQSPSHVYYRWKLYTILQGESVGQWRTDAFQMFTGGSLWQPPSASHHKVPERPPPRDVREPKRGELTDPERDQLEDTLRGITPERVKVAEAMIYCLDHSEAAEEIVDCIVESLGILQTPVPIKIARLYLVSDILYNCSTCPVPNSSYYRKGFESSLPEVFTHLHNTLKAITGRMRAEQFKRQVMNCLRAWEEWAIYPPTYLVTLQNNFIGITFVTPPESDFVPVKSKDLDGEPLDGVPSDDIDGVPLSMATPAEDDLDGMPIDDVDGVPFDEGPPAKNNEQEASKSNQPVRGSRWERAEVGDPIDSAVQTSSVSDSVGSRGHHQSQVVDRSGDVVGVGSHGTTALKASVRDEERRQRLREIELKVMKYADQLEKEGGARGNSSSKVKDYRDRLLKDLGGTQESDSEVTGDASSYDLFAGSATSTTLQQRARSPTRSSIEQRPRYRPRSKSRSPGKRRRSRSPKRRRHSRSRSPRSRRRKSRSQSRSKSPKKRRRSDH